jgi:hypothetical protein
MDVCSYLAFHPAPRDFSEDQPNQCVVRVLIQGDDARGNGFPAGFARTPQENISMVDRRLANGTSGILI